MSRIFWMIAAVALTGPAIAGERTVKLSVTNMTCVTCPYIVKQSLAAVPGVIAVDVSLPEHSAVVTFDDATTSIDALTNATGDAGFPSSLVRGQAS
jgi:periplasmic mercuric ion binding protein